MPAPLAKGLLISLSILVAAGIAVYESPQVREWINTSRRRMAEALHSLGDGVGPSPAQQRSPPHDSSTREDDSEEAKQRRERVRIELSERARILEQRKGVTKVSIRGSSFDDFVDQEGKLKDSDQANTTAGESAADSGLRNRHMEAKGAAFGMAIANPFADEMQLDISEKQEIDAPAQEIRESTITMIETSQQPLIDLEVASNHPSELLVDLTPTTSHSSDHDPSEMTVSQEAPASYSSIHEWAHHSTTSFYSPPESLGEAVEQESQSNTTSRAISEVGSGEHISNVSEVESMSDGEIATPDTWTEVGSVVSEEGV